MSSKRSPSRPSRAGRTGAGSNITVSNFANLVQAGVAAGQGIGALWSWANKDGRVVDAVRRAMRRDRSGPPPPPAT